MAIGSIAPWLDVKPSDFIRAANEGASAGEAAARTQLEAEGQRQRARSEAQRLALEAQSLNANAEHQAQVLSQQERLTMMEQAHRDEILKQDRMRQDQKMLIDNAYKTAQIGIAKDRVDNQKALADAKAKEAALTIADEQRFAQNISIDPATGKPRMSVMEAYQQSPRLSAAKLKAMSETGFEPHKINVGGQDLIQVSPNKWEPPRKEELSPIIKARERDIGAQKKALMAELPAPGTNEDKRKKIQTQIDALSEQEDLMLSPTPPFKAAPERSVNDFPLSPQAPPVAPPVVPQPPTAPAKQSSTKAKVDRAHELVKEHPDWSREDIIKAVNDEFERGQ